MNEDYLKILIKAKFLIAKPENWCKRMTAADIHGFRRQARIRAAVKFCAFGAVLRVAGRPDEAHSIIIDAFAHPLGVPYQTEVFRYLTQFNDAPTTQHKDVIKLFNTAIREARAKARAKKTKEAK